MRKDEVCTIALALLAGALALWVLHPGAQVTEPEYTGELVYPENPQRFIQPENTLVQSTAAGLEDPEACYYWVAQNVVYVPDYSLKSPEAWLYPSQTIQRGRGDCEDFAILLCSLIRAKGVPPEEVRVVAGLVPGDGEVFGHAWVELKHQEEWMPLEVGTHGRKLPPPFEYYLTHEHPEIKRCYWFNDVEYENFEARA
jgi:transglutaminase-like putative cysteine protease